MAIDMINKSEEASEVIRRIREDSEERKRIAERLCSFIEHAERAKDRLRERWKEHERLYNNEPQGDTTSALPGATREHIPLLQPRIDQLVANICGGITSVSPYFVARSYNRNADDSALENTIHFFLDEASFSRVIRLVARNCALCGIGIIGVRYVPVKDKEETYKKSLSNFLSKFIPGFPASEDSSGKKSVRPYSSCGIVLESIHPNNFIVFPSRVDDLEEAKLVGDRFYLRVQEIRERASEKYGEEGYIKEEVDKVKGDLFLGYGKETIGESKLIERGSMLSAVDNTDDDVDVELYQVWFVEDLDKDGYEEMYRAVIAYRQRLLLDIEEWSHSRVPRFVVEFAKSQKGIWLDTSPAFNLQGLQKIANDLWNAMRDGADMQANPPIFVPDSGLTVDKVMRYERGTVIEVDATMPPVIPNMGVDLSSFPYLLDAIQNWADQSVRISRIGVAGQLKSRATATEAAAIIEAQSTGLDEYHQQFSVGLIKMVGYVQEILATYFGDWYNYYKDAIPLQDPSQLMRRVSWDINGRTPAASPSAVFNAAMVLAQMAQDPEYGINKYKLMQTLVQVSPLDNKEDIQFPKEQFAQAIGGAIEEADDATLASTLSEMGMPSAPSGVPSGTPSGMPSGTPSKMPESKEPIEPIEPTESIESGGY